MNFQAFILLAWLNQQEVQKFAWCKDIWGIYHEYINVIDV